MRMNPKQCAVWAGLLLCAAGAASAQTSNSIVTFSVDMSVQVTGGTFIPGTDTVAARGTFNGYGTLLLTNDPGGANTNIYSGTAVNTADPNDGVMQYKFWNSNPATPNGGWESPADNGRNRAAKLPSTSGASLILPTPYFSDAGPAVTNDIVFRVNMAQQINLLNFTPGGNTVYARGDFNGFDLSLPLTNDPSILTTNQFGLVNSNVYVGVASVVASPNAAETFKYFFDSPGGNWEQPGPSNANPDHDGNRFFVNAAQVLPIVDYSDAPFAPIATNAVTFQVDMSLLAGGLFDPALDTVDVRGTFNGWGGGANVCTNDPNASNTNIYSTVVTVLDGVGATVQYKFTYGGPNVPNGLVWENPAPPTIGGNRFFYQPNTNQLILPAVKFSDLVGSDLLPENTEVTFNVDMTGAVQYPSGTPFNPGVDTVFVNGDFLGWWAWGLGAPLQYQMTNNPPGSSVYSLTLLLLKGSTVRLNYKYGIGGFDNEAGVDNNHIRFVRTTPGFSLPLDNFGSMGSEQSFGNLAVGAPAAGQLPITWLGRPGVYLQTSPDLSTWQTHPATSGHSATNWPLGTGSEFFRLVKPGS